MNEQEFLGTLFTIGSIVAEMFGPNCEVAISDLDNPNHAVLAIFNGHVTGREVGSALIPQAIERVSQSADGLYINYRKKNTPSGKLIKSSTYEIKFGKRRFSFCINVDCLELKSIKGLLDQFLNMTPSNNPVSNDTAFSASTPISDAIQQIVDQIGKPVDLLNKQDRLRVLTVLNEKGLLRLQKSVIVVAQCLGVSRYTIYNYLNELEISIKDNGQNAA